MIRGLMLGCFITLSYFISGCAEDSPVSSSEDTATLQERIVGNWRLEQAIRANPAEGQFDTLNPTTDSADYGMEIQNGSCVVYLVKRLLGTPGNKTYCDTVEYEITSNGIVTENIKDTLQVTMVGEHMNLKMVLGQEVHTIKHKRYGGDLPLEKWPVIDNAELEYLTAFFPSGMINSTSSGESK